MLVTQVINYQKLGYTNIKVNNKSYIYGQPAAIGGYIPDLSVFLDDTKTLCEVITNDSMNDPKLIEKWRMFAKSGYAFHMMIQKATLSEVKKCIKINGITVTKYWYSNYC